MRSNGAGGGVAVVVEVGDAASRDRERLRERLDILLLRAGLADLINRWL